MVRRLCFKGISFLFFPGNLTFLFQAPLEGLFYVLSLLIRPHPCHFSLVQFLSVIMYSFRIEYKLTRCLSLDLAFTNAMGFLPFVWISSVLI